MQIVKMNEAMALMTDEYYDEWVSFYHKIYEAMPATICINGGRRLRSMTPELWERQFEFILPLDASPEIDILYLICNLKEDGL